MPGLLTTSSATIAERLASITDILNARHARLNTIQAEIDDLCFAAYGFTEEDRSVASGVSRAQRSR